MSTNGNGNGNGDISNDGDNKAVLARLTERSVRQQERLDNFDNRIDAIEVVLAERSSWRGLVAPISLVVAALFSFYVFGLEPVKDTIAAEEKERIEEDQQIREGFKFGLDFVAETERQVQEQKDLRYTEGISQNKKDVERLEKLYSKLREEFNKGKR